jgi:hypothetical protein
MNMKIVLIFYFSALLIAMVVAKMTSTIISVSAQEEEERFTATLNGSEVSPPVNTGVSGNAEFVLYRGAPTHLLYNVSITGIDNNDEIDDNNITGVHLHNGIRGYNGTEIKKLPVMQGYERDGIISIGNLTASDSFSSELGGKGELALNLLMRYINNSEVYLDVHTEDNPHGELRGQVFQSP